MGHQTSDVRHQENKQVQITVFFKVKYGLNVRVGALLLRVELNERTCIIEILVELLRAVPKVKNVS
jgi:hypothetical protein